MNLSPRTQALKDLIALLRSDPEISDYVLDEPLYSENQISNLEAISSSYDGFIAVVPGSLSSTTASEPAIRQAWIDMELSIICAVWRGIGDDPQEIAEALQARCIGLVQGWQPTDLPYGFPRIQGDEPMSVELLGKQLVGLELSIKMKTAWPTITI